MSRLHFLTLTAFAGSILAVTAQADPAEEAPAKVAPAPYQLKNRSYFRAPQATRAPFWPIGFMKSDRTDVAAPVAPAPTAKLSPEMFAVTSILLGNPSLAVINGRAYGEGEFLRQPRAATAKTVSAKGAAPNPVNRIRVIRIVDGMVTLQSADGQSIVVPMRRAQLNERTADTAGEELLLDTP